MTEEKTKTDELNEQEKSEQEQDEQDDFEIVWKGYDSAEGQMLEEMLRQEDFTVRLIGTRTAALIGLGQHTAELRLEVTADNAEEARAVLKEFLSGKPIDNESEEDNS